MIRQVVKRFLLPPGPVLVLTLIGFMSFGALLYTRAVRAQRFLEPVLAITRPGTEFSENINRLLLAEFGPEMPRGIRLIGDSIYVESSLLSLGVHGEDEPQFLKKLSRVFLSAFKDPEISQSIDLVLVSAMVPISPDPEKNRIRRKDSRDRAGLVLNSIYREEPELERDYSNSFAASVMSAEVPEERANWIEFRVVHSHMLHIEVLQKLQKYMR